MKKEETSGAEMKYGGKGSKNRKDIPSASTYEFHTVWLGRY